jgi:hypothetical protein
LHMSNYCMQRNGSKRYGYAYFVHPSADTNDVRPRQRFLVFVQSISGFVTEFKWCGFWAAVFVFVVGVVGRSPFI